MIFGYEKAGLSLIAILCFLPVAAWAASEEVRLLGREYGTEPAKACLKGQISGRSEVGALRRKTESVHLAVEKLETQYNMTMRFIDLQKRTVDIEIICFANGENGAIDCSGGCGGDAVSINHDKLDGFELNVDPKGFGIVVSEQDKAFFGKSAFSVSLEAAPLSQCDGIGDAPPGE